MSEPQPVRVLLVPHCSDCECSMSLMLSMVGYDCQVAHDAEVAVARALEVQPQVLLVDLKPRKGDGLKLGRRLRESLGSRVRMIAIGSPEEGEANDWEEAGFDAWRPKPVDVVELLGLLGGAATCP